jgi:hypothetical protein
MLQWAYLTWFPEHGAQLVHPQDISALGVGVQGLVGVVSPSSDGWASFAFGERAVRVRPELTHPCAAPTFTYGQLVRSVPPRTPVEGPVRLIQWHFKDAAAFFLVGSGSSRYFAHELHAA